jgi:hypothetical protein
MIKIYKFLDDKNTIVRLISNKEEAEALHIVDSKLRIETVKVIKSKMKDDEYITGYELIGQGIV